MKEHSTPCIYYVCAHSTCEKGRKDVTHADTCQICAKYRPRKNGKRQEGIKVKRAKDLARHDNWKNREY